MGVGDPDKGFAGGIQGQPCGPLSWMPWIYGGWLFMTILGKVGCLFQEEFPVSKIAFSLGTAR